MEDGVSLKLGAEKNGMRFIVSMDESIYNFLQDNETAKLGIVISTQWYMESAGGDYLNMDKYVGGELKKNKLYQNGDSYCANACITNIKLDNFEHDFTAVAYLEYNGEIRYTEYNSLARNNLYDTVNMAVLNGYADEIFSDDVYAVNEETGNGWYGTEQFPIVVDNTSDYDKLVEIAKTKDLSDYYMSVAEEGVVPSKGFENEEYKPTVLSAAVKVEEAIAMLPNSIAMPEAIGMIGSIREAEKQYNALTDDEKANVSNYGKLEGLVASIYGYDRVYKNDSTDGTVIPSYVPGGYSSTVGGAASTRVDSLYGNVLRVQSKTDGRAALHFTGFPSVAKYQKIYFYVRILGVSCDIYLSDGITNDGWGLNWKNTWSTSGFWCNAGTWRLIEIDVEKDGYIGTDFALGFRTKETGITFEISDIYGYCASERKETGLSFGVKTATGETNEYGKVYTISREQWYIDNNNVNTIGTLQANKLANALPSGCEYFYFWMYNGTGTEYNFHLAGDVSGTWTDSKDTFPLSVGEWTEITISAEDIQLNKNGQWYVYLLGGDGAGAAKSGWKISTIYAGPHVDWSYTDYADVKTVIAEIDRLPESVTLADKEGVEKASAAFELLTEEQRNLVTNAAKLDEAKAKIVELSAIQEVIELIDEINPRDINETLLAKAREAYNALTDSQKAAVTNAAKLEEYEKEINVSVAAKTVQSLIAALPDSVIMPDHLVFVPRIEAARDAYNALSDEGKDFVSNYSKLRGLLKSISGYTTVYRQTVEGVNVIPSYVPGGFASSIGGSATLGSDSYYGNYLKVTSNGGGRAAIQFKNFPNVAQYSKLYFNIRVVGASCDIYLSDGITNDGWGADWKNTWSMEGFWTNNGNWIQKEVAVSTGIFASNWALGLRTSATGVSFEITDIIGWAPELGTNSGLTFGNFTASGEVNEYGTLYNFTQGWASETDMGAFNQNALKNALAKDHDTLHFWMYNPQDSAVDFKFSGDMNSWNPSGEYVTTLTAKAWTEVIITPTIIEQGCSGTWFVGVTAGAGVSGWKVSPIYSYSSTQVEDDKVSLVQSRIDALNTQSVDEYQVGLAREEYEKLSEAEKQLVIIDNLITCETKLYGNVENAPFITNAQSNYKLYYDGNALKESVSFVQEQLEKATGAKLSLVVARPENITKYRYAIVFGYEDLAQKLGLDIPSEETIGSSGYAIKRMGRTVFIVARGQDGYRMGALAFLREVIGYEMISEDCILYGKGGETLSNINLVETPSFEYRQQQTYMTKDELLGMGMQSHTDIWIPSSEGWDMHNALHYLPEETYRSAHASWYYTVKDSAGTSRVQICPTAGGSSAEFNTMVNTIVANMMTQINAKPTLENISFSIVDSAGGDACTCARCKLYNTLYGNAGFSAAWIDLINAVNRGIQAQIGDRKLKVAFLAYRSTEAAPANADYSLKQRYVINDNGSYSLQTENGNPVYLKCDEEVVVWLALVDGKYAENFNHADNTATLDLIKKWTALSNNVYLWMYGTNFKNYMYPYNSWQASAESYKIAHDLGVKAVWSQSNETEATAFSDLKGYIDSVFMRNVNADYEGTLNTYFNAYYGPAATKMRAMFDSIVAKCNEIEANYDGLGRGIYDELENKSGFIGIGKKTYWPKDWVNSLVTLCDEAKAAVNADGTLTAEQKTAIKNRITKESLFPRYLLCTTFAGDYSSSKKKELRQAFKADCEALNVVSYREADGALSDLYKSWGI